MRTRVLVTGSTFAVTLLASESAAFAKEKPTEVSKCVEEAIQTGQQADICVKAENPILPSTDELAIEMAEKVVERNLDRDTNLALIESYINQVSSQHA